MKTLLFGKFYNMSTVSRELRQHIDFYLVKQYFMFYFATKYTPFERQFNILYFKLSIQVTNIFLSSSTIIFLILVIKFQF
jgi:hypothetical protein